ncbi:alpha/beta hydrolase [Streptomyces sp. NBC_01275]|uniref:RBBP9/YdeN family alpha/beta hydrolase n=1 Tax=Streptomyces sp. NBC_01275 TaxID=2903807 RepID=UPI0022530618|nr:alpha/beta hydrolase [Streptomyces sp. NBC_01275]MCX4762305.1 alpha/beta hydrolase [Streptomyces sp. NBC_01275]
MTTTPRSYLVLHGWQNHRPEAHWQHWLADRLTGLGHRVVYPQLPDPDDPVLGEWLGELERHLAELGEGEPGKPGEPGGGERVVVAHSLSVVLWLHAVARDLPGLADVDRVLLVAPPSDSVLARYPEVAGFARSGESYGLVLPQPTRLVAGDDDPYCPEGVQTVYGDPLGLTAELLPGAVHLDLDAGYGSWPSVLDWCLDPDTKFATRPQR